MLSYETAGAFYLVSFNVRGSKYKKRYMKYKKNSTKIYKYLNKAELCFLTKLPMVCTDKQTNERTREHRATQPWTVENGRLSFEISK